ncbi:MAG: hypothetical protein E2O78_04900 [Caldithrix sp.]|nr:MAG: hypothetical protein E2O78_04900 [Caldithrix sp.]
MPGEHTKIICFMQRRGCQARVTARCPCHDGVFDVNGNVVSGPPPRPLQKYEVDVDENDNVFGSEHPQ